MSNPKVECGSYNLGMVATPQGDLVTDPTHRSADVAIRDNDGPVASTILAFAKCPLMAEAVEQLGFRRVLNVRY